MTDNAATANAALSYRERDIASVLHPQTNALKHLSVGPTIITGSNGVFVTDDTGKQYLDSGAGLWCASLGYHNERLAKVAYKAMSELGYFQIFRHASHKAAIDLSERLLEIAPVEMSKVLLQCSGSEANDTGVKIVWYYWNALGKPERRKIITRMGSYHGSTCVATSMTGNGAYHRSFGLPFSEFLHTDLPNHYRNALPGETEQEFSSRLADSLERMILAEGPETIAAFWADPVQGNAGALPPPAGYFEKVQAVLKKYGILFVADEVICGFGRTGEMWGCQTYDLKPDMIACAKGLSSGMQPISALLINDKIFEVLRDESNRLGAFVHGFTYAGHPVATAVALETLKIYEEMDIVAQVKSVEGTFLQNLDDLSSHPLVGATSGCGLIGGLELVMNKESKAPFPAEANLIGTIDKYAQQFGIILRVVPNRIAYSPSLIIDEASLDEMARRTRQVLDATLEELKRFVR